MSQEIRDMLTQRQSKYAWEAYLKHRKLEEKTDRASHSEEKPNKEQGEAKEVGHNKCNIREINNYEN